MKLRDLEVLIMGNPPPGFDGRDFIFVTLSGSDGTTGWSEAYASTIGPKAMEAAIRAHPYNGDQLHLKMQATPHDDTRPACFGGG